MADAPRWHALLALLALLLALTARLFCARGYYDGSGLAYFCRPHVSNSAPRRATPRPFTVSGWGGADLHSNLAPLGPLYLSGIVGRACALRCRVIYLRVAARPRHEGLRTRLRAGLLAEPDGTGARPGLAGIAAVAVKAQAGDGGSWMSSGRRPRCRGYVAGPRRDLGSSLAPLWLGIGSSASHQPAQPALLHPGGIPARAGRGRKPVSAVMAMRCRRPARLGSGSVRFGSGKSNKL